MHAHAVLQGILFVSHDAARAGAQIELLHFLRWFKRNVNRPFSMMLGASGELVTDFEELAATWSMFKCSGIRSATSGSETGVKTAIGPRAECR